MTQETRKTLMISAVITAVITGTICGVITLLLGKQPLPAAQLAGLNGLMLTIILTALLTILISLPIQLSGIKKGKLLETGLPSAQICYLLMPKNMVAFVIFETVMAYLIFGCAPAGLICAFAPEMVLSPTVLKVLSFVLPGLTSGFASLHTGFFVNARAWQKQS